MRRRRRENKAFLTITAHRGDRVRVSYALRLASSDEPALVPLTRSWERATAAPARLVYDASGLRRMRTYLRREGRGAMPLVAWCEDLLRALSWCARERVPYCALLYDDRHCFVDRSGHLRLVLVPLDTQINQIPDSPLTLLRGFERAFRTQAVTPEHALLLARLHSFVMEEDGVFSLNRYRRFVAGLAGDGSLDRQSHLAQVARLTKESTHEAWALVRGRVYEVGRAPHADICLASYPRISRSHATLRYDGEHIVLVDRGSANGSFVRGRRLDAGERASVAVGEQFSLAGETFCFESDERM